MNLKIDENFVRFDELVKHELSRLYPFQRDYSKSGTWCFCLCECQPGIFNLKEISVNLSDLKSGKVKSCGCFMIEKSIKNLPKNQIEDLVGQKFGRLLVLSYAGKNKRGEPLCNCLCDYGGSKSCGCWAKENLKLIQQGTIDRAEIERQKEVGQVYNGIKIRKAWYSSEIGRTMVEAECPYDGTIFELRLNSLKHITNPTKSCGCLMDGYMKALLDFYDEHGYFPGYIYQIKNIITGALYIGKTNWVDDRFSKHIKDIKSGKHHSKQMIEDYKKYGIESFEFKIIAEYKFFNRNDAVKKLSIYEKEFIEKIKPVYNTFLAKNYTNISEQKEFAGDACPV